MAAAMTPGIWLNSSKGQQDTKPLFPLLTFTHFSIHSGGLLCGDAPMTGGGRPLPVLADVKIPVGIKVLTEVQRAELEASAMSAQRMPDLSM